MVEVAATLSKVCFPLMYACMDICMYVWIYVFKYVCICIYPYGLNGRVGDQYMAEKYSRVVGNNFLPLHHLYKHPKYNYSKNKLDNCFLKQNFVKILTTHLDHNLKDAGYFFCVSIKVFLETHM